MKTNSLPVAIFIIPILTLFVLQSCTFYGAVANTNNANLLKLEINDIKAKLLEIMGTPAKNEKYQIDNKSFDIWFYRTAHTPDNKETDDEFTPVVMIDGKVVGWGRNYYDNTIKIRIENKN